MKLIGLILLALLVVVGCAGAGDRNYEPGSGKGLGDNRVYVWHDDERLVTCWIVDGYALEGVGIDCMPDSEFTQ